MVNYRFPVGRLCYAYEEPGFEATAIMFQRYFDGYVSDKLVGIS